MAERMQAPSRRNFLLMVGAGGVTTAAAIAAKSQAAFSAPVPDPVRRAARGYQATAHVTRYYRTTKV